MMRIFFVVQGLFEKSDSIGYDCIYQYRTVKTHFTAAEVRIFAERFDQTRYPDCHIEDFPSLLRALGDHPDALVIYHFCDGWSALESKLVEHRGRLILRWHNNTPPWFFGAYSTQAVERTVRGFRTIAEIARQSCWNFWCNSEYTVNQLAVLGGDPQAAHVVYPSSRFLLDEAHPKATLENRPERSASPSPNVRILFVGRVVAHKGHRHVLMAASHFQRIHNRKVEVVFPGRSDGSPYADELRELASELGVHLELSGEVDEAQLRSLYRTSTVLLFLSEHEGFGLPIYEAMRMDVPVIAWASTAVRELMADHPLALDEINYLRIAEFINRATKENARDDIVAFQRNVVLPRYTKQVVDRQIVSGMQGAIDRNIDLISAEVAKLPYVAREVRDHYFTGHDLVCYEALLTSQAPLLSAVAASNVGGGHQSGAVYTVKIPAARFTTPAIVKRSQNGHLLAIGPEERHVIFGPYMRLPAGDYTVQFDCVVTDQIGGPAKTLLLDVYADSCGVLGQRGLVGEDALNSDLYFVSFSVTEQVELVEFRAKCSRFVAGRILFNGVDLTRVPYAEPWLQPREPRECDQIAGRLKRRSIQLSALSLYFGDGPTLIKIGGTKGDKLLADGDQAMARRDWPQAISLYEAGLQCAPWKFESWVQLGHAYKELGDFAKSERAYERASELKIDGDLCLHLGHLLIRQGRLEEGKIWLRRGIKAEAGGCKALLDLLDRGFTISELRAELSRA